MKKIFTMVCLALGICGMAQVKIGSTGTPNANAVLELDGGNNKGLLLPRITTTDMNGAGFSAAPNGLLIYNTTDGFLYIRKTGAWQKLTDATNNGNFQLPYAGTASTVGGAEFSITHTSTFGDAAVFSNTASAGGVAIGSYSGNNKLNMTTGNTGIGIPAGISESPTLGKLVVRGVVGGTAAVFGDKTFGVSIENDAPAIGFNTYMSDYSKNIGDGYSARISQNPTTGIMYFNTTSVSGTAGNYNYAGMSTRMAITPNGNVGIGTAAPLMNLHIISGDSAVALFHNAQPLASDIKTSLYLRSGSYYTGAIQTTGTSATDARLGLFAGAGTNPNSLTEKLSVLSNGRVGIGITTPGSMLEIRPNFTGTADIELNAQVTGGDNAVLRLNKNNTGAGSVIRFKNQGTVNWDLGTNGDDNFKLAYTPANATVIEVDDATRNIGFRTSDFTERVNIGGNLQISGSLITKGGDAGVVIKDRSLTNYNGWNWYADGGKMKLYRYTTNADVMAIDASGNVGIGNTAPNLGGLVVDTKAGAVNAVFGSNTSGVAIESSYPGIGFNSYFSSIRKAINTGFGSLVGQDPFSGRFYIQTSATSVTGQGTALNTIDRLNILPNGNIGIQGNTNPQSPLSFANTTGEKINFYDVNANANYGIGIQGAQMQFHAGSSTDAISFGYGSSTSFTEKLRMQNGYLTLTNGRIRLSGQLSAGNTHGIEFTNLAGTAVRGFLGQYDDNNMGLFGYGGGGWGFLYDVNDGSIKIGTTQKAAGYLVNVGGKIIAEEVRVQLRSAWPDYVFSKNYKLHSLSEIEKYISVNNHLPNVPAAADIEKSGIALGEMQTKMMEKIEELTLYVIDLKKEIEKLKSSK